MKGNPPPFPGAETRPGEDAEIDLARLLYHYPDLSPTVATILGPTTPADPRLAALTKAVLVNGAGNHAVISKRELIAHLIAASVAPKDAAILAERTCDPDLVDHADRAAALAQTVALRRAEGAILAAGAA